jgi:biotin--[acetyl-coA-carboxylase] ligase
MNHTLAALMLEVLRSGESYLISDLAARLDCRVTELREIKNALQAQGVPVLEAGDNIQLGTTLPHLDREMLHKVLLPYHAVIKVAVDSTNQYILEHMAIFQQGDVCLSDFQFFGRGRRGRHWVSVYGGQINLSMYWKLSSIISANGLSLMVGLAVLDALYALGYGKLSLKWPNDILYMGRKLGGILIETVSSNDKQGLPLVIGVGLDLIAPSSWQNKHADWATLSEVQQEPDKNQLVVMIVDYLHEYLGIFEQQGFAYFRQQWMQHDYYLGKRVKLISNSILAQGIEHGVMDDGSLIIHTAQGQQCFQGGEISLLEA